jgi:hypothetical protein
MYFINDIHFIGSLIWCKSRFLDEITNIIYTGITRSIYLDYIEHSIVIKSSTIFTGVTRIPFSEMETIYSLGKYTSTGSFSSSSRSCEYVCMTRSIEFERISKDSGYSILSDKRIPIAWTICSIERHALTISKRTLKAKGKVILSPSS